MVRQRERHAGIIGKGDSRWLGELVTEKAAAEAIGGVSQDPTVLTVRLPENACAVCVRLTAQSSATAEAVTARSGSLQRIGVAVELEKEFMWLSR